MNKQATYETASGPVSDLTGLLGELGFLKRNDGEFEYWEGVLNRESNLWARLDGCALTLIRRRRPRDNKPREPHIVTLPVNINTVEDFKKVWLAMGGKLVEV
jgi:hypothetical protein